jgi:hypothetical protein
MYVNFRYLEKEVKVSGPKHHTDFSLYHDMELSGQLQVPAVLILEIQIPYQMERRVAQSRSNTMVKGSNSCGSDR